MLYKVREQTGTRPVSVILTKDELALLSQLNINLEKYKKLPEHSLIWTGDIITHSNELYQNDYQLGITLLKCSIAQYLVQYYGQNQEFKNLRQKPLEGDELLLFFQAFYYLAAGPNSEPLFLGNNTHVLLNNVTYYLRKKEFDESDDKNEPTRFQRIREYYDQLDDTEVPDQTTQPKKTRSKNKSTKV